MSESESSPNETAEQEIARFSDSVARIRGWLEQTVVGQSDTLDQLMLCALTGSHALLVGAPGLAKTLMVKAMAQAFGWKYSRIQFTPDLMPTDITGYELLGRNADGGPEMVFRPGPVFANLILADEINRAAPKTQSALLEAMGERHVTVGGQTYPLEPPFLVVATQNPIEQEGTYPLPEAQLDRFMMEIHVGYPSPTQEREIVMKTTSADLTLASGDMSAEEFLALRKIIQQIPVPDHVVDFAVALCGCSRPHDPRAAEPAKAYLSYGAGPRGSQNLVMAAKARAIMDERPAPTVKDVVAVALPVLRHRLIINHRALGDGVSSDQIIDDLLKLCLTNRTWWQTSA
ncbi:MoxR family ATPase [Stieleria sp. TO1_6]|uniref:AAA family ATPase n=1 Tax=Stieleria tagensis TaxID=2956795 RepID=UPI00209BB43E|nr:MoxR family ATPase [Stieleria tagensis]MCO8123258.1 MoxR family ATPase [Stieleria tagensis]